MNFRWLCFYGIFIWTIILSSPALADSPIDKEAALNADFDELIAQAQQAFGESDFEAALEYLVISNRLEPDPRLFLNIARSYEELGQCHIGLAYYEAFLQNPLDDPALIQRAEDAVTEGAPDCAAYHEDLGGRLRIDSDPVLATVYIDDELMGVTPTETAGLEPGVYTVRFELQGYDDDIQEIEIVPDDELIVRGRLQEESDEPEQTDVDDGPDIDDEPMIGEDETELNFVALGIAGAGVAGLITGAVFDMSVIPGVDEDRQTAFEAGDRALYDQLTADRDSYVTIALVSYVVGAALFAGGAGWFVYDMYIDDDDDDIYGWEITPDIGDDRAGVLMFRRF